MQSMQSKLSPPILDDSLECTLCPDSFTIHWELGCNEKREATRRNLSDSGSKFLFSQAIWNLYYRF